MENEVGTEEQTNSDEDNSPNGITGRGLIENVTD